MAAPSREKFGDPIEDRLAVIFSTEHSPFTESISETGTQRFHVLLEVGRIFSAVAFVEPD